MGTRRFQEGFIPLLICLFLGVITGMILMYMYVARAQQ
jgi:hypothetical protein